MFTKLLVFFACIGVILAVDKSAVMDCIKGKYDSDLGNSFTICYNRSGSLWAPRVKACYQDVMKANGVVVVDSDGHMTVDRTKFGEYGNADSQKPIRKAMKACYDSSREDDRMYKEAARASQCVFDNVRKTCNGNN